METRVYDRWPHKMVVGAGCIAQLPDEIKLIGKNKVLLITDVGIAKLPLVKTVVDCITNANIELCVYDQVRPQPTVRNVEDAVAAGKEFGADIIVSLGGGSSMDCARAVNGVFTYGGEVTEHSVTKKIKYNRVEMLPHIAIPTTAGTGGEVAGGGAIYGYNPETDEEVEIGLGDSNLVPDVAMLDPELTLSLPPYPTAFTGMDALTHAIEALFSTKEFEISDGIALEAIRIVKEYLPIAVKDGKNIEARAKMMIAANMATIAFSQTRLGLCHSMAMSLSVLGGVAHGVGNALLLPHIVRFNSPACPEKAKRIAEAFSVCTKHPEESVPNAITEMLRVCGLPEYLDDERIKFSKDKLDEASELSRVCGFTYTNPIIPTTEQIKAIFEGCYEEK